MRILLGLLLLTGCVASRPPASTLDLEGTAWRLVTLDAVPASGPSATLEFGANGTVSGSTGCNRFSGTYVLEGDDLTIGPLAVTRRACLPPNGEQERRILEALDSVDRVDLEDGRLVLSTSTGTRTEFEPATTPNATMLTGTVTYLQRIALPPDAVVTVRLLDVSLADAPSRTLSEQTIPAAGRSVPIPFALEVDAEQIEARRRYVVRAEIRDGAERLIWTTDTAYPVLTNGAPSSDIEVRVVQVERGLEDGAADLAGREWKLVQIDFDGRAFVPEGDDQYTVSFRPDGSYAGLADCNRYNGTYRTGDRGILDLEAGIMTLAACPQASIDDEFLLALTRVERWAVADGQLALRGRDVALVFGSSDVGTMEPQPTGRDLEFACDGFSFRIRTGPGEIALWLPKQFEGREGGTYHVLGQVRAASGAKYQDGPITVWTKGQEALLEVDGETFDGCQLR